MSSQPTVVMETPVVCEAVESAGVVQHAVSAPCVLSHHCVVTTAVTKYNTGRITQDKWQAPIGQAYQF